MDMDQTKAEHVPNVQKKELTLKNRLAYAGTDAAGNLLYCTLTSFINFFHTDVFGLSIGVAATIALTVRIINTLTVPLWGLAIDKTKSKYGKARPWFARLAIPFGTFMALTFLTPNLGGGAKVAYAAFTYLTASILYTGISTPITAILPNLSNNSFERTKLNSYRMIGGNVGYFITATFTLTLVSVLGGANRQLGFFFTVLIYALVSIFMFFFAFKNTKEVNSETVGKSLPVRESFKALKANWPWVIIVLGSMCYWLGNSTRTSSLIYYARYNLENQNYVSILNGLVLTQMLGVISIPFLVKHFSKTTTMIIGFLMAAVGQVMLGAAGGNFPMLAAMWVLTSIGTGITVSMPFAMLSDTVDYGEFKTGIRASGFLTAVGSAVGLQVGTGFGDFIPLKLMQHFGYVANQAQTSEALKAIKFGFAYLPAIFFVIGALVMLLYVRFEKQEAHILTELERRRLSE
ncbi:MFS transporter [Enterococcus sp.]|uniref:MFS transporter n=1 Tax=Enterococcus sp. TaxID=35783 RepID=UPI002912158A|nr:MFS transporter [Enterococcus sp.]MDU5334016.1 MFS transporter [Enterococcus sp.]